MVLVVCILKYCSRPLSTLQVQHGHRREFIFQVFCFRTVARSVVCVRQFDRPSKSEPAAGVGPACGLAALGGGPVGDCSTKCVDPVTARRVTVISHGRRRRAALRRCCRWTPGPGRRSPTVSRTVSSAGGPPGPSPSHGQIP